MEYQSIKQQLEHSANLKLEIANDSELLETIAAIAEKVIETFKNGNRLLLCGNGGSASDALHLATEFSGRYLIDRKALPAEALNVNVAALTAISNDYSFDQLFVKLLESKARKGDLLWAFSTSGNSPNIVHVLEKANIMGVNTIAFTGRSGGKCVDFADQIIKVPSEDTPRIQEMHITMGHIICEIVENKLFNE